jgi:hypothetical protein
LLTQLDCVSIINTLNQPFYPPAFFAKLAQVFNWAPVVMQVYLSSFQDHKVRQQPLQLPWAAAALSAALFAILGGSTTNSKDCKIIMNQKGHIPATKWKDARFRRDLSRPYVLIKQI